MNVDGQVEKLAKYLNSLTGGPARFLNLLKAHANDVAFRNKAFKIFRRELIFKRITLEEAVKSTE